MRVLPDRLVCWRDLVHRLLSAQPDLGLIESRILRRIFVNRICKLGSTASLVVWLIGWWLVTEAFSGFRYVEFDFAAWLSLCILCGALRHLYRSSARKTLESDVAVWPTQCIAPWKKKRKKEKIRRQQKAPHVN